MEKLAKDLGVRDRLLLMGFERPIEPWISACDIVLAVSLGDAFGRTIIESMYANVPVIGTNAGGHSELIQNNINGILVEASNYSQIVTAATKLLENRKFRENLIANAKEKVLSSYLPEPNAMFISKIYEDLIRCS